MFVQASRRRHGYVCVSVSSTKLPVDSHFCVSVRVFNGSILGSGKYRVGKGSFPHDEGNME